MENNVMKDTKKQFSKIGLVLLLGTLIIYGIQILFSAITSNIPAIAENGNLSFLASMMPMYIIAYPVIFLMFKKIPVQISGEKKKMRLHHLLAAFLICYAGTYICNILANIITAVISVIKQAPVDNVMLNVTSNINPAVNLFVIVICAPIMEELLFRKTIIDRTAAYGEGISIVFSGLLFGLFHGNLVQFAYAFFLGAFFGFIYIKTRNIVYPIILHVIINFFGSFISTTILEVSGYTEILEASTTGTADAQLMAIVMDNIVGLAILFLYMICLIAFVVAGIVIFSVNKKKFQLTAGKVTIEKGQRIKTIIFNLGVILYSAFWIVQIILQLMS